MADNCVHWVGSRFEFFEGLRVALSNEGIESSLFSSAEAALASLTSSSRGCIVVDLDASPWPPADLTKRFRANDIDLPEIFLVGNQAVSSAVEAMQHGAFDVVERPVLVHRLRSAIQRALEQAGARREHRAFLADLQKRYQLITPQEKLVLQRVLDGYSNKKVAADLDIGQRTVEARRASIMAKLGASTTVQMVRYVLLAQGETGLSTDAQLRLDPRPAPVEAALVH